MIPHHRPRIPTRLRHPFLAAAFALGLALSPLAVAGEAAGAVVQQQYQQPVDLGSAAPFAVLAGVAIANTNLTTVTGNVGVSPGTSVTGFPPGTVNGTVHTNDATAITAKSAAVAAYNDINGRSPTATVIAELGGTTKGPGVYASNTGSFSITGTLTLDAEGEPDAVFIFKASSLATANVSNINLVRGAQPDNVFWQLTGSATIGTFSTFRGNILAANSVTVSSGSALQGRVMALNGTATLQGTSTPPATRIFLPADPPTTTTLTTSPNPSREGQPVTLTATVQPVSGSVVPYGEVVFKDGATVLGSAVHSDQGPATLTVSDLAPGEHPLTAVYLGGDTFDGEALIHFAPSRSAEVIQVVTVSLWTPSATPATQNHSDTNAVTLGVKFRAAVSGTVNGIRFFKGSQNTGTHIGTLWTTGGQQLASATFTGETASGWQQVNFANPVTITPGTTYIASYHTTVGRYSLNRPYFTSQHVNGPLTALANGEQGGNGVYTYGATNTFPTSTFQASNYWIDVAFVPHATHWQLDATPAIENFNDGNAVTLGVKFRSTSAGVVRGIRFFKGSQNTGTHIGTLWTTGGQQLASATFTGETASGWQQVNFANPVTITPGTTYIASYHTTVGRYSLNRPYFTSQHVNGPLTALANGEQGGNGVYTYGATNTFPTSTVQASNYWVDVAFDVG